MTYTLPTNITDIPGLFSAINGIVGGDMVVIMLSMIIFLVAFIASGTRYDSDMDSLVFAAFVTAISSVFLAIIVQTSPGLFLIPMVLLIAAVFLYYRRQ